MVRRTEIDASGAHTTIAEEFVVLDRAGRLQLPHDYVEKLDLESRVRLTLDPDHINVWPDRDGVSEGNSNGTDRSRDD